MSIENKSSGVSRNTKKTQMTSNSSGMLLHTYTPQSHENLLKQLSKTSFRQQEVKTLKKEINRLKVELKKANVEIKLKDDRIKMLENRLLANLGRPKDSHMISKIEKMNLKGDSNVEENSGNILSEHFSEVMKRHQDTVGQKDRRIRELQALVAELMNRGEVASETQIGSHDLSKRPLEDNKLHKTDVRSGSRENIKYKINNEHPSRVRFVEPQKTAYPRVEDTPTRPAGMTDIHRMEQYFLKRLDVEEELDALFWEIERTRFQMLQHNTVYDGEQRRAYENEFEMFRKTRDQLLKELGGMRATYNRMKRQQF